MQSRRSEPPLSMDTSTDDIGNLPMRLWVMIILAMIVSGCGFSRENAKYLDSQIEDPSFDIHEVEYSTTPDRFNTASYSHINRDSKVRTGELTDVRPVTDGAYGDWVWKVYADQQGFAFASKLARRQAVSIDGKSGPRPLTIPSWNDAFTEFAKTASVVFGATNIPLEVHITIVGQQANFSNFVVHNDDHHLVLDYYFALDESIPKDPKAEFQWLVDTVATVGHEFSHAFIYEQDIRLPNAITNEVMAYTMEQCVKLAVVGTQAGITYLDKGGKAIDPDTLDFSRLLHTQGSASLNAYYLAEYDTVHVLGASTIDRDDVSLRERLLGLCVAQYQHVNDFEESFYPVEEVHPVSYQWNGYEAEK